MIKRLLYFLFLFILTFTLSVRYSYSQDTPCASVTITVGGGCIVGDNTGATTAGDGVASPSCFTGNPSNYSTSVWYKFVATDDSISINFGDGTLGTQTIGAVYSSSNNLCSGVLTEVGCAKGGNEINVTTYVPGNTYFILVDGAGNNVGTFCISTYETPPPPPPMGTCANPKDLFSAGDCDNIAGVQYDNQDNIIFTDLATGGDAGANANGYGNPQGLDGGCADNDATQNAYWVRFTATVTSAGGASTKTYIRNGGSASLDYAIYKQPKCNPLCSNVCPVPCSNLQYISCVTIAAGATTEITGLTKDSTYMAMITNTSPSTVTQRYACLTSGTTYVNPNNACAGAAVMLTGVEYTFNTAGSTVDGKLCSGSTENNIWAKWTVPACWPGGDAYIHLYNQDCACGNGTQMSIYNANLTCANINGPTCVLTINPNNSNDFVGNFTPVAGATYLFDIDGYAGCGCQFNFQVTNSSIDPDAELTADAGADASFCNGGCATLGGAPTGPVCATYLWSPATGLNSTTVANPTACPTITTTYTVTVTDLSGCTDQDAITITVLNCCGMTLTETHVDVNCFGASTGSINLTVAGGTAPITYSWSNSPTTEDISALSAGTYTVTVVDVSPCTSVLSVTILQNPVITPSNTQTNIICPCEATGAFDLSVVGGVPGYTYTWSNGPTTQDQSGLSAGTYNVTITDTKSCTKTYSVILTEPPPIAFTLVSQTNIACFGGTTGQIVIQASGGAGPYDYSKNGGGTWDFLDIAGGTPVTYSGLIAGTYVITVRDGNGCITP